MYKIWAIISLVCINQLIKVVYLLLRAYAKRINWFTQFTCSCMRYGHFPTIYRRSHSSVLGFRGILDKCAWIMALAFILYRKHNGRSLFFSFKLDNFLISCYKIKKNKQLTQSDLFITSFFVILSRKLNT